MIRRPPRSTRAQYRRQRQMCIRDSAHGGTPGVNGCEDVLRLEVNIRNNRDRRLLRNRRQRIRVDRLRAGHAHDVTTSRCQLRDLLQSCVNIVRLRRRHRLHTNRVIGSDTYSTHEQLAGLTTRSKSRRRAFRDAQTDGKIHRPKTNTGSLSQRDARG